MKRSLLVCLVLAGCNYNHVKIPADQGASADNLSAEQMATPDYKTVTSAVIGPRCFGCHSAQGGNQGSTNLESYPLVRSLWQRISYRALEKRDMPPGQPLSPTETQVLQNWIDSGVPETIVLSGEKPDPTLNVGPDDWKKVRDKIFLRKCNDCHSPGAPTAGNPTGTPPAGNLDLTDMKTAKASILKILDRVISKGDMPIAPYPAVTPAEHKVLLHWFDMGMPE